MILSSHRLDMSRQTLLKVFTSFPKELFRVNNGPDIKLRTQSYGRRSYDILKTSGGLVEPKALTPDTYVAPNGASLRPNSPYQQSMVAWRFRGNDVVIYAIPRGTKIPEDLILVHERSDHYSLQPATVMTIHELQAKLTRFIQTSALAYSREQWIKEYPRATDHL